MAKKTNLFGVFSSLLILAILLFHSPQVFSLEKDQKESHSHYDEGLTLEEFEKLRNGKVIIKTGYHAPGVPEEIGSQIAAVIYLKAQIEDVWNTLSDWKSYEHIIPNVQDVKLIEQEDNRVLLYFNLLLQVKNIEYFLNYYFFKEKNLVTFQLDRNKKNDFRRFHGYFKFDPVLNDEEGRVQVVYSVDVELGKYFPDFIKNYFAKKDIPKVISNLRNWVERNQESQKED